jgi:tRNA pseudouridine38-40 synthase
MMDEHTYCLELQYDGTGLHGWAKQPGRLTVEGSLEKAFATILGSAPLLRVAGRTDAGVHARRQVASLSLPADTDAGRVLRSLNALTPAGIAVTRLDRTWTGFDARRDADSRSYRYFLQVGGVESPFTSRYSWHVKAPLHLDLMRRAAALTEGRHDFTAFTPAETEHVFFHRMVLRCRWGRWGSDRLVLHIEADTFLRHMVRSLVGTMVEIGLGRRTLADWERLLTGGFRHEAGRSAPPRGLFLWDVRYPQREVGH